MPKSEQEARQALERALMKVFPVLGIAAHPFPARKPAAILDVEVGYSALVAENASLKDDVAALAEIYKLCGGALQEGDKTIANYDPIIAVNRCKDMLAENAGLRRDLDESNRWNDVAVESAEKLTAQYMEEREAKAVLSAQVKTLRDAVLMAMPQIHKCSSLVCGENGHKECAWGMVRAALASTKQHPAVAYACYVNCPHCGATRDTEGDRKGESVHCDFCHNQFMLGGTESYSPKGNFCSVCNLHDQWCAHIKEPA